MINHGRRQGNSNLQLSTTTQTSCRLSTKGMNGIPFPANWSILKFQRTGNFSDFVLTDLVSVTLFYRYLVEISSK